MWIAQPLAGHAALKRFLDACSRTGMTEDLLVLADLRIKFPRTDFPPNCHLVPVLGPVSFNDTVAIARGLKPDAAYLGFLPSGYLPRSPCWDTRLASAAGDWNIAQANDLHHLGRHPLTGLPAITGAVALGGKLARAIDVVPKGMEWAQAAATWSHLGRALGLLEYRRDVVIENTDWAAGGRASVPADFGGDPQARLFRWLNDEARPLIRDLRFEIGRDQRRRESESPAVPRPQAVQEDANAACAV